MLLICSAISFLPLWAQNGTAGTENILHENGMSARAFGLGRAYVALADDPAAVFWNPAGLEYVPQISMSLFHQALVVDQAAFDFLGFVYPTLNFGTVGLGVSRVGVGGIPVTDVNAIRVSDDMSYDFTELYISYAKKSWWSFTPGVTFKFQRQSTTITQQQGSGFAIDGGMMYRPDFDNAFMSGLSLGLHFQNMLKPQIKPGSVQDTLRNKITLGFMKSVTIGDGGKMNILLDVVRGEGFGTRIHAGTEYQYRDMATLRAGFDQNSPAFGAGLVYKFMQIDYAFGNLSYDSEFPASHRFSLTFNLGLTRNQKIQIAEEARRDREKMLVENTKEEERQRRVAIGMQKGSEFLKEGQFFDAYSEFQQVISDDPFNKQAKVYFDSSRAQIQNQFDARQQEAIAQAIDKELAEENKKFIELHFQQGQVFLQKRQYTDALKEFNLALERSEGDPLILEAIATTRRRLNAEVRTLVTDARGQFQNGNYFDALRMLSEALVLSPDAPELKQEIQTLTNRIKLQQFIVEGLGLMGDGDYGGALEVFEAALQLDPSNAAIQRYYDQARMGRDSRRERMSAEDEKQYIIGTEHFLAGRYDKALEIWRQLYGKEENRFNKKLQDAIKTAEDRIQKTGGDSR
ncbi:MAG TPA: PorV/PorQ family protein [Calditrichia bacterium]|nr:PorV/PorQ family protein [Calditrichota bacterium]HQU71768.1 PorV/PorQ family protein [Calditrichia bacterium]HQV30600.1 PorV/PorQ family protein [Calditrichia bacterium]